MQVFDMRMINLRIIIAIILKEKMQQYLKISVVLI